jgi:hypothetical protein
MNRTDNGTLLPGSFTLLLFLGSILLFPSKQTQAQGSQSDGLENAISLYSTATEEQLLLYNGRLYIPFPEPYLGTPYFNGDIWTKGTVLFNDHLYVDIDMFYDVHKDRLVVEHHDRNGFPSFLYLDPFRVSYFTLDDALFVTLSDSVRSANNLPEGFFQLVHEGEVSFYVKRSTQVYKEQKEGKYIPNFKIEDKYYLMYENTFHQVRTKSAIKKIMRPYKKQLNAFARENNLIFMENTRENALKRLIMYCDELVTKDK